MRQVTTPTLTVKAFALKSLSAISEEIKKKISIHIFLQTQAKLMVYPIKKTNKNKREQMICELVAGECKMS